MYRHLWANKPPSLHPSIPSIHRIHPSIHRWRFKVCRPRRGLRTSHGSQPFGDLVEWMHHAIVGPGLAVRSLLWKDGKATSFYRVFFWYDFVWMVPPSQCRDFIRKILCVRHMFEIYIYIYIYKCRLTTCALTYTTTKQKWDWERSQLVQQTCFLQLFDHWVCLAEHTVATLIIVYRRTRRILHCPLSLSYCKFRHFCAFKSQFNEHFTCKASICPYHYHKGHFGLYSNSYASKSQPLFKRAHVMWPKPPHQNGILSFSSESEVRFTVYLYIYLKRIASYRTIP